MSKPALGRGLGDLMNKATSPKTIPGAEPQENESPAGPGVSSLLKGRKENVFAENEESVEPSVGGASKFPFPVWYLFAADIVLLLFAFLLVFKDTASLDWKRIALATIATVLGGALAAAGVLLGRKNG